MIKKKKKTAWTVSSPPLKLPLMDSCNKQSLFWMFSYAFLDWGRALPCLQQLAGNGDSERNKNKCNQKERRTKKTKQSARRQAVDCRDVGIDIGVVAVGWVDRSSLACQRGKR